jgi:ADP-ribose pyrophosphatase
VQAKRRIHKGRLVDLNVETAAMPDGSYLDLEIVRHPGGAAIVAINERGEVCLLRQFRHAVGEARLWELPAGCIDASDESPLATATRELREEAGVSAESWRTLGTLLSSPGFCDERLHLYLAGGLTHVGSSQHDDEYIEIHWLPFENALKMAAAGEITDAKTVVGLFRAKGFVEESAGR